MTSERPDRVISIDRGEPAPVTGASIDAAIAGLHEGVGRVEVAPADRVRITSGTGLMKTYDALPDRVQAVVKAMSDAARDVMREHGLKPRNDDRAAIFDEACAVFLTHSLWTGAAMTIKEARALDLQNNGFAQHALRHGLVRESLGTVEQHGVPPKD